MNSSLLENLPDHCLELILDKLILDDFDNFITCCKRLTDIGKGVNEMRKIRLHEVIKQNRPAKWQLLHSGESSNKHFMTPGPRFGSTLVYLDNSIYLFGGATVNWTTFNDLWRFDLKEKQWSRRIPRGTCPPPRASGNGILYQDKLIIIGGFELKFSIHAKRSSNWDNLPWVYDFSANDWTMMPVDTSSIIESRDDEFNSNFHITPTSVGQSACLMLGDCIILFGGAKALLNQSQGIRRPGAIQPYYLSDQTLSLCISTATVTRVRTFGDISPAKRCGHSAVALDRNRMLLVGGYLGPNTKGTEDMWLLTYVESSYNSRCQCTNSSGSSSEWRQSDSCWYWTAVVVDQPLQPLSQFVKHAQVVPGGTAASSSTLVILGGASAEIEDALFPPTELATPMTPLIEPHRVHNKSVDELAFRRQFRALKRSNQLIVHAADLEALTSPCRYCYRFDPLGRKRIRWIAPLARCQDLENAPNVRQGFSVVAGPCSLFLFGGLMFRSVFTRPVYLLNDLMVRDDETEDTVVKACSDLHELTYRRSAIVL